MREEEELSIATGKLAAVYLAGFLGDQEGNSPNRKVHLYPIRNDFFGEMITVAGLITGRDLIPQLKDKPLGSRLLSQSVCSGAEKRSFWMTLPGKEVENSFTSTSEYCKIKAVKIL